MPENRIFIGYPAHPSISVTTQVHRFTGKGHVIPRHLSGVDLLIVPIPTNPERPLWATAGVAVGSPP